MIRTRRTRIVNIVSQSPDGERPDLDAMAAASLAANRTHCAELATRAARISFLSEDARDLAYTKFAAELFNDGTTWIAGVGFSLDTTDGVTSVKIALDDQHFALLDPAEGNRAVTTLLGLTLSASKVAR
jgi:hypothetical protein